MPLVPIQSTSAVTILGGGASEAAAQVLAEHALGISRCTCGWLPHDDVTHPQHVLHEMQLAGLDVRWR